MNNTEKKGSNKCRNTADLLLLDVRFVLLDREQRKQAEKCL